MGEPGVARPLTVDSFAVDRQMAVSVDDERGVGELFVHTPAGRPPEAPAPWRACQTGLSASALPMRNNSGVADPSVNS